MGCCYEIKLNKNELNNFVIKLLSKLMITHIDFLSFNKLIEKYTTTRISHNGLIIKNKLDHEKYVELLNSFIKNNEDSEKIILISIFPELIVGNFEYELNTICYTLLEKESDENTAINIVQILSNNKNASFKAFLQFICNMIRFITVDVSNSINKKLQNSSSFEGDLILDFIIDKHFLMDINEECEYYYNETTFEIYWKILESKIKTIYFSSNVLNETGNIKKEFILEVIVQMPFIFNFKDLRNDYFKTFLFEKTKYAGKSINVVNKKI